MRISPDSRSRKCSQKIKVDVETYMLQNVPLFKSKLQDPKHLAEHESFFLGIQKYHEQKRTNLSLKELTSQFIKCITCACSLPFPTDLAFPMYIENLWRWVQPTYEYYRFCWDTFGRIPDVILTCRHGPKRARQEFRLNNTTSCYQKVWGSTPPPRTWGLEIKPRG